ncbi:probable beta-hexosaminidase fdl [Nymphalis io]|uniref:probable beta-hexosaminidase fdl n=1 Tax=Inachis io TaxID=171585 RepID=UPI00216789A1|nr:probable beta-hexosaminidase fdl [Nymphalis io]
MSDDESCSECYLESIERKWNQILLNWVNKCIVIREVQELSSKILVNIINKYKDDISIDESNTLPLRSDGIKFFIRNKFPILRIWTLVKENDYQKITLIMTSLLLYYFCTNSQYGKVDADIYEKLSKEEQMIILKFCENLAEMEVTINNIGRALRGAYEVSIKEEKTGKRIQKGNDIESELEASSSISYDLTKARTLKFKSSITVLPSVVTDTSLSKSSLERFPDEPDYKVGYLGTKLDRENIVSTATRNITEEQSIEVKQKRSNECIVHDHQSCQSNCSCTKCSTIGPCCGDPGSTKEFCDDNPKAAVTLNYRENLGWTWICQDNICQRLFHSAFNVTTYSSISRCTLLCSGLPLWPYPIGNIYYNKTIVTISTKKLEYKFKSVPSVAVQEYLSDGFNLFLKYLIRIEKSTPRNVNDSDVKKINIQIDIESDPDPRLRLSTDETYSLKLETIEDQVFIKISSESFCGIRHGLETLRQLILLDQSTGHLITLSNIIIKDGPTYKYRGLMIDTARNFIPIIDLMRTIDAMASCKLNTFHWRISDATSFPLYIEKVPELYNYGPYDKSMVYTRDDVKLLVKRAGVRAIRIIIEVAAPGPVGRPWSWLPETTCPKKSDNLTCENILCLRLSMQESVFNTLQTIYTEIIKLTHVDDVFHLSDSLFSFTNCYNLINDRDGFLDKALVRLKMANKGFLPRLPIIWYTPHLNRDYVAKAWNRFGVQLSKWDANSSKNNLSTFRVIHSSKWDLSCEMIKQRCSKYRSWQQMYAWTSWRNFDTFTVEGGECILWTDIVDASSLDYHLWPRAAAVAERLWSDVVANSSANKFVYLRLDMHRSRMLLHGIKTQPIWPAWCSSNPNTCLKKVH